MLTKLTYLLVFLAVVCILPETKATSESTKLPRKLCNKGVPKSDKESVTLKKLHLVSLALMAKTVDEKIGKLKESSAATADEEIMASEERAAKLKKALDNIKKGKEIDTWSKMELAKLFLMKSTKLSPSEWGTLTEDKRDEFLEELRCMLEELWKDGLKNNEWDEFQEELWPKWVKDEL